MPEATAQATESPLPETTPETTPGEEGEDGSWSAGSKEENVQRVADLGKEAVEGNLGSIAVEDEEIQSSENSKRITLKDRQKFRTSEEETQLWIEADNKVLEESDSSYEGLKIACLGDSITEATNLDDLEDYEQYSYPARLKEALGAEEVVNLGIGGSSYGRYWDHAFCERYKEIPEDTDLIIVMGGDNDGFCLTEDLVGSLEQREQRTLYGDVDELMRGLKENYPNARVVFMTPMPNLLHDVLRKDREELLSQTVVVNCILELAE
jgi:lysophospholipase L1-like esterase